MKKIALIIIAIFMGVQTRAVEVDTLITGAIYERDAKQTEALLELAGTEPNNAQIQFLSGFVQMLEGVEELLQDIYRYYGILRNAEIINGSDDIFQQMGLNKITEEPPLSYAESRRILQDFTSALERAEAFYDLSAKAGQHATLIDFSRVSLDLDKDGVYETSYAKVLQRAGTPLGTQTSVTVAFDLADTYWFQGYANLLGGLCNAILSYEWQDLHYRAFFHLANINTPDNPYPFLGEAYNGRGGAFAGSGTSAIMDLVAAIHSLHFPLAEGGKDRLLKAHGQLLEVPQLSRKTMAAASLETDDHREWIPNPKQISVVGAKLTQEQIDGWVNFTKRIEKVLEGDILLPFWRRTNERRGVNLKKFFTEPMTPFIPAYVVQGSLPPGFFEAAMDTEKEIADQQFFRNELMLFDGVEGLALFSIWFN